VVLAQDLVVAMTGRGHADGADLAHADAVSVAAARRRQRRHVAAGVARDVEDEHRALEIAERAADLELAAHLLRAAVADELHARGAPRDAALDDGELAQPPDAGARLQRRDVDRLLPAEVDLRLLRARAPRPVRRRPHGEPRAQLGLADAGELRQPRAQRG